MTLFEFLFWFIGTAVFMLFVFFAVTSARESKPRAAIISGMVAVIAALVWIVWYQLFALESHLLALLPGIIVLMGIGILVPLRRPTPLGIGDITERVDERDIMFAREEYEPGSDKYTAYYPGRPELKEIDDRIRQLPELFAPGGRYYDSIRSPYADSIFKQIEKLTTEVDGEIAPDRQEVEPREITSLIKTVTLHLGADEVGIASLNPAFVYSHVGRGPEPWGEPIEPRHRFAIMFTLEMSFDNVETAPQLPITEESARAYLEGASIATSLAQYIRDLGYPARAHIAGSNYQIMLPPVAYDAGLGELGRHGYLISHRFGARVRLGAVTTDLPLVSDTPKVFGVQDFCKMCLRCAANCPSGSIPGGGTTEIRGVHKWPLRIESCFHYWRAVGTDCGLCMRVCPFSHPPTAIHNLIRYAIKRNPLARWIAVQGENLFYGREVDYPKAADV
jgi:ferredoxin